MDFISLFFCVSSLSSSIFTINTEPFLVNPALWWHCPTFLGKLLLSIPLIAQSVSGLKVDIVTRNTKSIHKGFSISVVTGQRAATFGHFCHESLMIQT